MFDADYLLTQIRTGRSEIARLEQEKARLVKPIDEEIAAVRDFISATETLLARRPGDRHAAPQKGAELSGPVLRLISTSPASRSGYGAIKRAILEFVAASPNGLSKREIAALLERSKVAITAQSYAASAENNVKDLREKGQLEFRDGRYFIGRKMSKAQATT